jgi:peptidyl-prolyl cis-trans isomerase C
MSVPGRPGLARSAPRVVFARGASALAVLLAVTTAAAHGEKQSLKMPPDFGERILARVNEAVITGHDFHHAFEALPAESQATVRPNLRKLLDVLVQREILYQEAVRAGLDRDRDVLEQLERLRRAVLVHELSKRQRARAAAEVGEDEARRYYDAHREQFTSKERISASHILVETRADAEAAAARLRDGADFATLAEQISRDEKTRGRGGRLYVVFRGQLSRQLEEAAFALKPGELSGIVQDADGYHLVLLHDHVPAALTPFETVRATVQSRAVATHSEKRFKEFTDHLEQRARIELNDRALSDVK